MKSTNPQSKAYPKVAPNSTRSAVKSDTGRTVEAKQGTKNVNVPQGPKVGTQGRAGKRGDLMAQRAQGAALAKVIQNAYGERKIADSVNPKLEGIAPNVKPMKRGR